MVKYCDCEVGTCEGRDSAARCAFLHHTGRLDAALRADLEALTTRGKDVLQCLIDHDFEPGEDPRISDFAQTLAALEGQATSRAAATSGICSGNK